MMRVISGKARGSKLFAPSGKNVRPTADFVKENLFNIIQNDVRNARFLDLFSGSGAMAIEALSRGAKSATLVEASQKSLELISKNLEKTRLTETATIIKGEVPAALERLSGQKFNIIFADPPYFENLIIKTLEKLLKWDILENEGYIIIEADASENFIAPEGLKIFKEKIYGTSKLFFLERVSA